LKKKHNKNLELLQSFTLYLENQSVKKIVCLVFNYIFQADLKKVLKNLKKKVKKGKEERKELKTRNIKIPTGIL